MINDYKLIAKEILKFGNRFCIFITPNENEQVDANTLASELSNLDATVEILSHHVPLQARPGYWDASIIIDANKCDTGNFFSPSVSTLMLTQPTRPNNCVTRELIKNNQICFYNDAYFWDNNTFKEFKLAKNPELESLDIGWLHNLVSTCYPRLYNKFFSNEMKYVFAGPRVAISIAHMAFLQVTEHILTAFSEGSNYIYFQNCDEALCYENLQKAQRVVTVMKNIAPASVFFYGTGALNGCEQYKKWCDKHQIPQSQRMNILSANRFEHVARSGKFREPENIFELIKNPLPIQPKPNTFLCYNRVPRLHRIKLFSCLYKLNLIEDSLYSFSIDPKLVSSMVDCVKTNKVIANSHWKETVDIIKKASVDFPLTLNITEERPNPTTVEAEDEEHFANTYFSVVTETLFYQEDYEFLKLHGALPDMDPTDSIFFSEKMFKPFLMRHPFLLLNLPYSLLYLQKQGYKTFSKWIDESYDTETNDDKRLQMIVNEIQRLSNLSDEQWVVMLTEMKPVLEHNLIHHLKPKNIETSNLNYHRLFKGVYNV